MFYVPVNSVILWEIVNLLRHVNISGYQIPIWCPITSISCSKLQPDHDVSDGSLWMRETAEGVGRIRVSWDSSLHLLLCPFSLLPSSPGQSSREFQHALSFHPQSPQSCVAVRSCPWLPIPQVLSAWTQFAVLEFLSIFSDF